MRPRLNPLALILLLSACNNGKQDGDEGSVFDVHVDSLRPTYGSARGGQEVCVRGDGMEQVAWIWFGTHAHSVDSNREGAACATTKATTAAVVPVRLQLDDDRIVEAGVFTFEPLDLQFTEAAAHYLPAPTGDLIDGVVVDLNGDGYDDIITRDTAGTLANWQSTGTGALIDGGSVQPEGPIGGVAKLQNGGDTRIFICHTDGEAPRLLHGDGGDLTGPFGTAAAEAAVCSGAVALDLDQDGNDEVIERRADNTARVWRVVDGALQPYFAPTPSYDTDCPPVEGAGTRTCTMTDGVALLTVEGEAAAFVYSLPAIARRDAGFVLRLGGDIDRLEVTDAEGAVYAWVPESSAEVGTLARIETPAVADWDRIHGHGRPARPLARLAIITRAPLAAASFGGGTLRFADGGEVPFARFEQWPADLAVPYRDAARVDTDQDGQAELALATASGPLLYVQGDAVFTASAPGQLPSAACDAHGVEAVDIDEDGQHELFFTCVGQDLLYRGDGAGYFFEDSIATLPVDAGDGRGVIAPDLDRDGLPDLVIATWYGVDRLYHGNGAHFDDWSPRLGLSSGPGNTPLALDLDGDNDLDLVVLQGDGQPARLLLMSGE